MIPKIDFQVHDVFINAFHNPPAYGSLEQLHADMQEFKDFFSRNGNEILKLIEVYSGYEWSKERIPVYLIPDNFALNFSFTKPVLEDGLTGIVQKISPKDMYRNIHIHIHELVHVNQRQSDFYTKENPLAFSENGERNITGIELGADIVTFYILQKMFGINSEYEKNFWNFLSNTNEKNKLKFEELNKYKDIWDLNLHPLRYYVASMTK